MSLDPLPRTAALSALSRSTTTAQDSRAGVMQPGTATEAAPPVANPRLRLDPALGMVVMEFRSGPGVPARSIPSAQELAAYRAAALTGAPQPGEDPLPAEAADAG